MSDETIKVLESIENNLYEKINTDKRATTKAEMQAFNRGIAEATGMIRALYEKTNDEFLKEIGLQIK